MDSAQNGSVVIIGSGLAGYTLAREFRKLDQTTPVTVITADGGEAYSKPMLSNALSQQKSDSALVQKTADQMGSDLSIRVLTHRRVSQIDRAAKVVHIQGGHSEPYGRLVLALGADARSPGLEGPIYSVNDLDDFRVWRSKLAQPRRILVIGAGLVGCELANDLTSAGHHVTMVDPAPWPLGRLLPQELGEAMSTALRDIGIELYLNTSVSEMTADKVALKNGAEVSYDLVLSAIGLVPRAKLAEQAGIAIDRGIVVDRRLQTSDHHIYALGDCAQSPAGLLPFVMPLMAQARTLAGILAGGADPLRLPPLPVVVKTPCLPLAVCPPAPGAEGTWEIEGQGRDLKALFMSKDGAALGFALSGKCAAERQSLAKLMPNVLD